MIFAIIFIINNGLNTSVRNRFLSTSENRFNGMGKESVCVCIIIYLSFAIKNPITGNSEQVEKMSSN